jgi:hypothetical protein
MGATHRPMGSPREWVISFVQDGNEPIATGVDRDLFHISAGPFSAERLFWRLPGGSHPAGVEPPTQVG